MRPARTMSRSSNHGVISSSIPITPHQPFPVDIDGDGIPDVVLSNQTGSEICVYLNENGSQTDAFARHFTHVNYTLY